MIVSSGSRRMRRTASSPATLRSAAICPATVSETPGIVRQRRSPSAALSIAAACTRKLDGRARRREPVTHVVGHRQHGLLAVQRLADDARRRNSTRRGSACPAARRSSAGGSRRRRGTRAACSPTAAARRSPSAFRSSSAASVRSRRRSPPGTAPRTRRSTTRRRRAADSPSRRARTASSRSRVPSRLTR